MARPVAAALLAAALLARWSASAAAAPGGAAVAIAPDIYTPLARSEATPQRAAPLPAEALLAEALLAAAADNPSRALRLATLALRHDPDQPTCRRVLGYERVGGHWVTAYQKRQLGRGLVWSPAFGWVKADDLPRYMAGERRAGRRWLSTEEDAARHATIDQGWQVRTDNFQVTTNHSLPAAASLAAELERLYQVWRQLFAGYHLGADEVRARFAGERNARVRSRPLNVIYHRDKSGYVAALRHRQPRIAETLGIYFEDTREAHFFANPGDGSQAERGNDTAAGGPDNPLQRATLYHEAVHQLFSESVRTRGVTGGRHNFWAVEAAALYFETLTPDGEGGFTIGGLDGPRGQAARANLADGYLVPFEELAALGRDDLQRRPDLPKLYSQMAGMAAFLIEAPAAMDTPAATAPSAGQAITDKSNARAVTADTTTRREAFVAFLRELYSGRAKQDALWRRLGESPDEVEQAYRQWLLSSQP
ncbi:MAG: hypothetical protein AAGB00_03425 [Planctomycetota bacterium]